MKKTTLLCIVLMLFIPTFSYSDSSLTSEDLEFVELIKEKEVFPDDFPKDANLDKFKHEDVIKIRQLFEAMYGIDIRLLRNPDPKFSSPESTWQVYTQALESGNIELALSCLTPYFAEKQRELLKALGPEHMKEMAKELGTISVIKKDDKSAKYRNRQKEMYGGKEVEMTYYVYFVNFFGNWRIQQY